MHKCFKHTLWLSVLLCSIYLVFVIQQHPIKLHEQMHTKKKQRQQQHLSLVCSISKIIAHTQPLVEINWNKWLCSASDLCRLGCVESTHQNVKWLYFSLVNIFIFFMYSQHSLSDNHHTNEHKKYHMIWYTYSYV